ncbi:MAG: ComF family protein [Schwartzia sp.]|nr:ComF family protein [Schwartzia sp. (in: firmicutes)]
MRAEPIREGVLPFLKNLASLWLDFLFPSHCPVCGAYVDRRGAWCPACLANTVRVRRLSLDTGQYSSIDEAWAFGLYHGALRELLLPLKFKKQRGGLPAIRSFLMEAGSRLPRADWMPSLAVPVPLFAEKEKERGGNQTEMIFRDWLTAQGWTWRCALVRVRATEPQFGLSAPMRALNIKDAFALASDMRPEEIAGKPVLLVDDILTTGATLVECARTLRAAGASSVTAWALASDRG